MTASLSEHIASGYQLVIERWPEDDLPILVRMRARDRTRSIEERDLTVAEVNDVLHYLAWNEWDALAARATETPKCAASSPLILASRSRRRRSMSTRCSQSTVISPNVFPIALHLCSIR